MEIHMGQTRLILASGSPRRRELLGNLGLSFEVKAADVDESTRPGESARLYVGRLAREKAAAVAAQVPGALVLAADTTVVLGEEIFGKPERAAEAARMLRALSGKPHQVLTAVSLAGTAAGSCVVTTTVHFQPLGEQEIAWYVASGEPMDKAGAYAIQGKGGAFVRAIEGSYSNVVGLPLSETVALLREAGCALPWSAS
jgi:septum formation protein